MQVMTENRVVPQLRFKEFQNELKVSLIKNLTKVYDGTHSTPKYVDNGIPFYSVEHISSDDFTKTKYISEEVFEKENKRVKLERGDILMTRIGSVGVAKLIDWEVNASFYVSLALFKNNPSFHSPFLAFYINSISCQKEIWKRTIHVAFPKKINLGEISNCKVVLPSLTEQQKIASFLSAVDEKLQQLTKKKELLSAYKKGVMQKIFSQELRFKDEFGNDYPDWEEKKLGDLCDITTGKSNREDSGLDGEYTFFDRSEDIRTSSIYLFDAEAVIVAGEGSSFPPKYFRGKFDLHQRTYAIMGFENLFGRYLFYYLHQYKNYFVRYAVGSTVKSLRLPIFKKMKIHLPSFEEQKKVANFLSSLDSKIDLVSTQIEKTKAFKKGLLQQMFV
jgi:type I restriction enzyme S subunit